MRPHRYKDKYETSHALIIGIDAYVSAGRLQGCVNDANAVRQQIKQFGFDRVEILLDGDATRNNILDLYNDYSRTSSADDRLLIFFAGHGFVTSGNTRQVGYLVPVDGVADDYGTLIRWDELTNGTQVIPAKHVLFIVDACFSGLIFSTTRTSAITQQIRDALSNYARQAISSGKSYQPVDDLGGQIPGHSRFTSSLLKGLDGAAIVGRAPLTASALGIHLQTVVGDSLGSAQTPEYGKLEGEGDFVFNPPPNRSTSWVAPDARDPEVSVEPLWGGRVSDEFLIDQENLDIFLKDGFGFFHQRTEVLRKRFSCTAKTTRIAIVHPNFIHIDAVGDMDAAKKGIFGQQRRDCMKSIAAVKAIASSLPISAIDLCAANPFVGCHVVPTWNGFIGDKSGSISMYFSRPYRGPLNAFTFQDGEKGFFSSMKQEFDALFMSANLDCANDLWSFDIGEKAE